MTKMISTVSLTFVALSSLAFAADGSACVDDQALQNLAKQEINYMLQRIPPAFADAVSDQQIRGEMTLQDSASCQVHWQLTLPEADIAEAQALLQAEPAKQIMLAAQGYQLPDRPLLEADFSLDASLSQPKHQETLQTAALGKLRATVELMYAMLTQARANGQGNGQAWTMPEKQALQTSCAQQFQADNAALACQCYSDGLADKFSSRQVKYNQYLASNPYAFATGNGASFKQLDKSLQTNCGLTPAKR